MSENTVTVSSSPDNSLTQLEKLVEQVPLCDKLQLPPLLVLTVTTGEITRSIPLNLPLDDSISIKIDTFFKGRTCMCKAEEAGAFAFNV